MTEDQQAPESQEETEGQAQEAATDETREQGERQDEGQEPKSIEELPEWVQKEIRSLRTENAKARKERQKQEDAKKTELQKLTEERDSLQEKTAALEWRVMRSTFIDQINLPSARLAWASLSDLSIDTEWDEKGNLKNAEQIRKALKAEFPREFGDGSADGSKRGPEPKHNDMNALIRGAAGRG